MRAMKRGVQTAAVAAIGASAAVTLLYPLIIAKVRLQAQRKGGAGGGRAQYARPRVVVSVHSTRGGVWLSPSTERAAANGGGREAACYGGCP